MIRENQIWKIYGSDYRDMTKELLSGADLETCIRGKFDRAGEADLKKVCIGIKPNLVCPTPAELGATTHTQVIAGIIEYLQERGYTNLKIVEGSWVGDRTSEAYEVCGYRKLCNEYSVPFIDTQKEKWHVADCAGMKMQITNVVDSLDFLINVPVLKGHCQTRMTCALKNMKGLITNKEKRHFHQLGLHKPIAHLNAAIRPDFIVIDHICGDLDFEEGGNPVVRNCIMAALDPVLTDSYACYLMHYTPDDVPYVRMAEKLGVGTADLDRAEIITLRSKASDGSDSGVTDLEGVRNSAETEDLPAERRLLEVAYAVEDVDSCSACYGNLIPALYRLREEGLLDKLHEKIAIGQGQQGRTGVLGIGRCTKDFDTCIPGCPPDEEKIYKDLKDYIIAHEKQ